MSASWDRWWYGAETEAGMPIGLTLALTPLSWAYRGLTRLSRAVRKPRDIGCPVISVGNLTLGGSGKTPLVIALVERFLRAGKRVSVLSRGYGRSTRGLCVVNDPDTRRIAGFEEVGDEPLLIALRCPRAQVVVGSNRVEAGLLAVRRFSPDVVICDDAFQHWRLSRRLDIVAIHAERGLGNGQLFPRGPLREPVEALGRAGLVVFTHASAALPRLDLPLPAGVRCARAALTPIGLFLGDDPSTPVAGSDGPVVAVCGIGHPEGFFASCRGAGLHLVATFPLADHRALTARDFSRLDRAIAAHGARAVVVTEKDWVRFCHLPWRVPLWVLRVESRWVAPGDVAALEESLRREGLG